MVAVAAHSKLLPKGIWIVLICIFLVTDSECCAFERNAVISTINDEYYSDDYAESINKIKTIDITLDDDTYLQQVFECLDSYSQYYTKEQYENQAVFDTNGMIAATIEKNEIHVKIDRFGEGVAEIFSEYIKRCKEKKIRKLILDLTECPGGYVHVMNAIANEIMPEGNVLTAKFRNKERVYTSNLKKCPFDEIIVKVSSQTASAAEILAAGLQESGVAAVIGVNTYGKTTIQSVHSLESGAVFKLTCGKYLTRNGNDISKTGVIPDVVDYSYPVKIRWNDYCKQVIGNNKAVSK